MLYAILQTTERNIYSFHFSLVMSNRILYFRGETRADGVFVAIAANSEKAALSLFQTAHRTSIDNTLTQIDEVEASRAYYWSAFANPHEVSLAVPPKELCVDGTYHLGHLPTETEK